MRKQLTGIVQKVEYTHGGAGNQFTTIDGVRYTTFWDIRTRDWKEGDSVQFVAVERSLWEGQPKAWHAESIAKVTSKVVYCAAYTDHAGNGVDRWDSASEREIALVSRKGAMLFEIEVSAFAEDDEIEDAIDLKWSQLQERQEDRPRV